MFNFPFGNFNYETQGVSVKLTLKVEASTLSEAKLLLEEKADGLLGSDLTYEFREIGITEIAEDSERYAFEVSLVAKESPAATPVQPELPLNSSGPDDDHDTNPLLETLKRHSAGKVDAKLSLLAQQIYSHPKAQRPTDRKSRKNSHG